jgi:N-sulfoglucosamine sulfohydrolase
MFSGYRFPPFFVAGLLFSGCSTSKSGTSASNVVEQQRTDQRPNIIIAMSDDQSYPHAGIYGDKTVQTPAFDRLAANGILFHNAFAAAPGCAPSRTSVLTGRFQWQNEEAGGHWTIFPENVVPFPVELEESGYLVGYTGKGVAPFNWQRSAWDRNAAGNEYNEITYTRDQRQNELPSRQFSGVNYAANFETFLNDRSEGQPFYFWFGASEPHRAFEEGSGLRAGKNLEDVVVPGFYPDHEIIRSDMLDYALAIDWFDKHLGLMVDKLEEIGELENTIIIVTSDQGMPFPRAKTNLYDYGLRVPFAVHWPKKVEAGQISHHLVSLADIAPTVLEVTGVQPEKMLPMSAMSFVDILTSTNEDTRSNPRYRSEVYAGLERHSSARWANLGYPKRSVRTDEFLYIHNYKPERWPAGAPQRLNPDNLEPDYMHGLDENGKFTGEAYYDIDASPTKGFLIENMNDPAIRPFYKLAMAKRPSEELYDVVNDPYNLNNLAKVDEYQEILGTMRKLLFDFLSETGDPRVVGPVPDIFENYQRYGRMRGFPRPDWIKND